MVTDRDKLVRLADAAATRKGLELVVRELAPADHAGREPRVLEPLERPRDPNPYDHRRAG